MLTAAVQEDGGPGAARGQAAAHPADRLRGPAVARQHQRHEIQIFSRYSVDIQLIFSRYCPLVHSSQWQHVYGGLLYDVLVHRLVFV